jgi:hypothetical protein
VTPSDPSGLGLPNLQNTVVVAAFEAGTTPVDAASGALEHLRLHLGGRDDHRDRTTRYYDYQVNRPVIRQVTGVKPGDAGLAVHADLALPPAGAATATSC